MHVLYNRPGLFQHYAAADPSFWWNGSSLLQEQAAFLAGARAAGGRLARPIRLLVENAGPAKSDDASPTPAADLATIEGLQLWHRRLADRSHGSMLEPAVADALLFAIGAVPQDARRL